MIEAGKQSFSDWDGAYGIALWDFIWRAMHGAAPNTLKGEDRG